MSRWTLIKNWIWNRTLRYWRLRKYRNSKWPVFLAGRRIDSRVEYLKWVSTMRILTTCTTRHYINEEYLHES